MAIQGYERRFLRETTRRFENDLIMLADEGVDERPVSEGESQEEEK